MFHQGQATEAQKYAKEKYGAEVFIFDGKSDSATMTANVDQILAQGQAHVLAGTADVVVVGGGGHPHLVERHPHRVSIPAPLEGHRGVDGDPKAGAC